MQCLRWLVRASVAGSANSDVKSESNKASVEKQAMPKDNLIMLEEREI